jgi:hypothetical protein
LAQKRINAAEKAKTKADTVHADSFLQLDVLVQAVDAANSLVAEAENSKTSGTELETLTLNATMAESLQSGFAPQVKQNATTKKGAATALINRQAEVVPLLAVAAEADTAMQLAAAKVQTATAAKEVALQALTKLGLKPSEEQIPSDDETGEVPPTVAATAKAQLAKRANAVNKYKKATADAKRAQTALATVQAACTKTSKDVALAKTKMKKAGRVKTNADKAHMAVVVQRDLLVKVVGYTQSQLTTTGQRKAGKPAMDKLTTAAEIAVADHQAYQTTFASSARAKREATAWLTKFQEAFEPLSKAAADATRDKKLARGQLETAMAAHDVSREAMQALGIKVRTPGHLPTQTHRDPIQPPLSPTPKVRYVTKPKMERNKEEWYQMIGTEKESDRFYKTGQANKEALPVGAVIQNAIKYYRFNQPCTAQQALAWAQLDDLSTGYTVDLNSYNPTTHMVTIMLLLLQPDNLPEDAFEWPHWLATTTIDLNQTNYPDE